MSFLPVGLTTSVMSGGRATSSVLCPPVSFLPKVCESVIAQSCPALCNLMACSPLGFSVRGVSQTRIQDPLLQGIFLTQGSNLGLLHCRQILYHPGSLGLSLDKLICQKWYFCFSWAECTFHLRNIWEFRKRLQAGNAVVVLFRCVVVSDSSLPHGLQPQCSVCATHQASGGAMSGLSPTAFRPECPQILNSTWYHFFILAAASPSLLWWLISPSILSILLYLYQSFSNLYICAKVVNAWKQPI